MRLARRTYVSAQLWCSVPAWDRHSIAAAAFSLARPGPVVFTGLTGAHLRGLPVAVLPPTLQWRATTRGHRGRQPLTAQAVCAGLDHAVEVPSVPDQQARWGLPTLTGGTASTSNTNSTAEPVGVVLSTGVSLGPVPVDAMPSLALVLGAHHPFRQAVPPLDAIAARHPVPLQRWVSDAPAHVPAAAARARLRRAAAFADPRSESAGESLSRVLIEEIRFAPPTALQHAVQDERGRHVARVDFWWQRERVVGEFDGIGKYDLALHGGDDAARRRSIRREKEREVALQRVTSGVAHWTWADLRDPQRLARILTAFGVPRR